MFIHVSAIAVGVGYESTVSEGLWPIINVSMRPDWSLVVSRVVTSFRNLILIVWLWLPLIFTVSPGPTRSLERARGLINACSVKDFPCFKNAPPGSLRKQRISVDQASADLLEMCKNLRFARVHSRPISVHPLCWAALPTPWLTISAVQAWARAAVPFLSAESPSHPTGGLSGCLLGSFRFRSTVSK